MATNNSWNNQVTAAYNQIILNSGSNGVAIGTDNATGAITIGTGTSGRTINIGLSAANNLLFLGTSNGSAATNIQAGSGNLILNSTGGTATLDATSGVSINSTAGTLALGDGANSFNVNVGTAGTRTVTIGSVTSTSATTLQSGSGALAVTSTGGALTINSGVGALGISTDASATTVSFATGGAVKTVTLGSTNTTSSTAIKSGSGNIALNSGLTVDSTGRTTNSVQPAFNAYNSTSPANVTGDGTSYNIIFDTEIFDQGSNFNSTTGVFTAPVTGLYCLIADVGINSIGVAHTTLQASIVTTQNNYICGYINPGIVKGGGNTFFQNAVVFTNMTTGDTALVNVVVVGSTKTIGIAGGSAGAPGTFFSGYLVC